MAGLSPGEPGPQGISRNDMNNEEMQEEKAPLLGKWSYWYALVIGFLLFVIAFFYFLTKHFS